MIKVKVQDDPEIAGTSVWIYDVAPDGSITVVCPVDLTIRKEYKPSNLSLEPTLRFSRAEGHDFLQGLAQALVANGYRPDELKSTDKQIEATKYHLEDMRRLVFNKEEK